jgi:hypothetical protein
MVNARRLLPLGPILGALLAAGPAFAQNDDANRSSSRSGGLIVDKPNAGYGTSMTISALGALGSYSDDFGIGVGGLFGLPIVEDGFIPSLNESFHLEFGLFTNIAFTELRDFTWLSPIGGVRWDWHIVQEFTAYAALRTGVAIGIDRADSDFYFDGLIGGFWRFSKPVAVRFELGGGVLGSGISGGVAFFL